MRQYATPSSNGRKFSDRLRRGNWVSTPTPRYAQNRPSKRLLSAYEPVPTVRYKGRLSHSRNEVVVDIGPPHQSDRRDEQRGGHGEGGEVQSPGGTTVDHRIAGHVDQHAEGKAG